MDDATGRDICEYHNPDRLDYLTFFADAERREKLGQKQIQCPGCKRWFWRHELGKKPKTRCNCTSSDAPGKECPIHGEAV